MHVLCFSLGFTSVLKSGAEQTTVVVCVWNCMWHLPPVSKYRAIGRRSCEPCPNSTNTSILDDFLGIQLLQHHCSTINNIGRPQCCCSHRSHPKFFSHHDCEGGGTRTLFQEMHLTECHLQVETRVQLDIGLKCPLNATTAKLTEFHKHLRPSGPAC